MENEDDTDFSLTAKFRNMNKKSTSDAQQDGKTKVKGFDTSDAVPFTSDKSPTKNSPVKMFGKPVSGASGNCNEISGTRRNSNQEKNDHDYDFTHPKRGVCVIINNMQFNESTGHNPRRGSEKDAENLETTFKRLGFEVKLYENKTCLEMYTVLQNESKSDHSDEGCFVCVLLSHGDREVIQSGGKQVLADVIFGKDGIIVLEHLTELLNEVNCPTLKDKPKIFISQACRGTSLCEGVEYMETVDEKGEKIVVPTQLQINKTALKAQQGYDEPDFPEDTFPQDAPIDIDFILVCSSPPGYYSFRSPTKGSYFIKAICEQLNKLHNEKDLLSILTRVNHQVAYEYTSNMPSLPAYDKMKQMPWIASKLTKCVYLHD